MDDLQIKLERLLEELECYPSLGSATDADDDLTLQEGHPLCDIGRSVVRSIPDSKLDSKQTPNFPGTGGRIWYRLLRTSRTSRDVALLEQTTHELSIWIREHYRAVLESREVEAAFDTFLSHNSKDKSVVRELADALLQLGLRPWLDERELVPGRPWQDALEDVIQTTKSALVTYGPAGIGPWEEPEMRACLGEFVTRKLPVIPTLLPGAPQQPNLPLFLKAFTWVDLRDGLNDDGMSRLVWGITGRKPENRNR